MFRPAPRVLALSLLTVAACTKRPGEVVDAEAAIGAGRASLRDAPNVLVVTLDTFRADHMPGFGGDAARWPELARWSSDGRRFTRAYTVAPVTIPAHTSLFTGNWPSRHGVRAQRPDSTPRGYDVLTAFAERGYRLGGFTSASVLSARYAPLYTAFERYTGPQGAWRSGVEVVQDAARWLDSTPRDQPVLVWVHFFETHFPYVPAAPRFEHCAPMGRAQAMAAMREYEDQGRHNMAGFEQNWWGECLRELYAGEVDAVDALMRSVRGLMAGRERWIWAVVADHGECVDDEGIRARHAGTLLECAVHIPLVIGGASVTPGDDARPASIIDVGPTLARLAGLELGDVDGGDLLGPTIERRALHFESPGLPLPNLTAPQVGAWLGNQRLSAVARPWRLDARSWRDGRVVATSPGEIDPELRSVLERAMANPPPDGFSPVHVEDDTAAQLRVLGYMQ